MLYNTIKKIVDIRGMLEVIGWETNRQGVFVRNMCDFVIERCVDQIFLCGICANPTPRVG